ncbi:phospholipase C [Streptomyces orinoci]|uniref:Alkaline phosphatase family protein n=1 Tax=Streptomyces orinoci TaxID=67339 RepID=A0A348AZ54_STRON|nr:alkaline phosphatase family protein [Streptomyces orinoci]BBD17776.1 phosphoesterase [Streptomyces orinoci]
MNGSRTGAVLAALAVLGATALAPADAPAEIPARTTTPVKHLVVIFGENVSFDHYFATYPRAANTDGTPFVPRATTPVEIDNLRTAGLLVRNPNQYPPRRLGAGQAMTCDQNHSYGPEQYAAHGGAADRYVQNTGSGRCSAPLFGEPGLVMDYYDGNTVTALWNYAQHYALNDRSFGTTYGPSTPGAVNLVSGRTHGVVSTDPRSGTEHPRQTRLPDPSVVAAPDAKGTGTLLGDPDPAYDDCSGGDHTGRGALAALRGRNIGDLLNSHGISWGWFQGGFRPSSPWDGRAGHYARCSGRTHTNLGGAEVIDYIPHHAPFQYYRSTANPHHLPPASPAEIGHSGPANHAYDLADFDTALRGGRLPAVSFLKAAAYQDGHAGYSDPIDEQHFLVEWLNRIQRSPQWRDTAVVIAYDDSDGWYDHAYARPLNGSRITSRGPGGRALDAPACRTGPAPAGGQQGRCGPGPRLPLLVISPYSRAGAVDHTPTEQTSVLRFIEDNWGLGRLGGESFDARAGTLANLFDFTRPRAGRLFLNPDGSVAHQGRGAPGTATRCAPACAPAHTRRTAPAAPGAAPACRAGGTGSAAPCSR